MAEIGVAGNGDSGADELAAAAAVLAIDIDSETEISGPAAATPTTCTVNVDETDKGAANVPYAHCLIA